MKITKRDRPIKDINKSASLKIDHRNPTSIQTLGNRNRNSNTVNATLAIPFSIIGRDEYIHAWKELIRSNSDRLNTHYCIYDKDTLDGNNWY